MTTCAICPSPKTLTQNDLLTAKLLTFFKRNDFEPLKIMLDVINGESAISLRIIDWFSTNYAKKNYTVYAIPENGSKPERRFKVYLDYKLNLKAYSKKRFDPFCRWDRIAFPYLNNSYIQTTVGQLNFFKWAIDNQVIHYIEANYRDIEHDMNSRNSISKRKHTSTSTSSSSRHDEEMALELTLSSPHTKRVDDNDNDINDCKDDDILSLSSASTRKRREELSILASSCIKKEMVEVVVTFE
jgi:hypothetical protein